MRSLKKFLMLTVFLTYFANAVFAAIVSDNDGSAFVTKAEFDALKNSFNKQIDDYNSSIDNKIDGSIASYLSAIALQTNFTLQSNLDSEGKYGGVLEYWSSSTTGAYDSTATKYAYEDLIFYTIQQQFTYKIQIINPELKAAATTPAYKVSARDYRSSKNENIKLNDGTILVGLRRGVYSTKISWSYSENKAYRATAAGGPETPDHIWTPLSPQTGISNVADKILQGVSNLAVCAANGGGTVLSPASNASNIVENCWTYFSTGAMTVVTDKIETAYDEYNVNYPLSTSNDYYWNTNDTTTKMVHSQAKTANSDNLSNFDTAYHDYNGQVFGNTYEVPFAWAKITPGMYLLHTVPWCSNTMVTNEVYPVHWNAVTNENRQIKNGIILTKTTSKGRLHVKASATEPGKLYLIVTNTPISNWTSSSFAGKVFNMNTANSSYDFDYGEEVNKDQNVWCIYLPNDTSKKAILKINDIYQLVDG